LAVELDRGLAEALNSWPEAQTERLKVMNQDILTTNLSSLGVGPFTVAGNIPYNLSTPILFWFLNQIPEAKGGVFTLQKEMAQSLLAKPGDRRYGRLSVAMSLWAEIRLVLNLKATAFQPVPKVESAAVSLVPKTPPPVSLANLGRFTAKAFHARRKTLANNLIAGYGPEKAQATLKHFQVDPKIRTEKLPPDLLAQMAKYLEEE
jgi:16S rRNA (adenine1518-N6/adenine1519-N6)-dimethyltransferase